MQTNNEIFMSREERERAERRKHSRPVQSTPTDKQKPEEPND